MRGRGWSQQGSLRLKELGDHYFIRYMLWSRGCIYSCFCFCAYVMLPKGNISEVNSASANIEDAGRETDHTGTYMRTEVLLISTADRTIFWDVTQCHLAEVYWCQRETYRSIFMVEGKWSMQQPEYSVCFVCSAYFLILRMEAVCCFETVINFYQTALHSIWGDSYCQKNPVFGCNSVLILFPGRILNRFTKDMGTVDESLPLTLLDCVQVSCKFSCLSLGRNEVPR